MIPVYGVVDATSAAEFTDTVRAAAPLPAALLPEPGDTDNQLPPLGVVTLALALQPSVVPPVFKTVAVCEAGFVPRTAKKLSAGGAALITGGDDVIVNVTGMMTCAGFDPTPVTVRLP